MALPLRLGKKNKPSTHDALRRVNDLLAQSPLSKPVRRKRRKPTVSLSSGNRRDSVGVYRKTTTCVQKSPPFSDRRKRLLV